MRIYLVTIKPEINITVPERENAFNYNPSENDWVPIVKLETFFAGGKLPYRIITDTTDIWVDLFNEIIIDNPYRTVIRHATLEELSAFLFVTQGPWYLYGAEEIEI